MATIIILKQLENEIKTSKCEHFLLTVKYDIVALVANNLISEKDYNMLIALAEKTLSKIMIA